MKSSVSDKMAMTELEIDNEQFFVIDIKCRTTNEDENCQKFFKFLNKMILTEKNITYPITIKKSELIITGDKFGIGYFNLESIKQLIENHFEFDDKFKYILTFQISYLIDEVIPHLTINCYKIQEFPNLLTDETFDKLFTNDETNDEIVNDSQKRPLFILSNEEFLDKIEIEYYEDMFSDEKIEYLISHNVNLDSFQDILKCPIIDWGLNGNPKNIVDFNQYIKI
jgi:hypothetical protein